MKNINNLKANKASIAINKSICKEFTTSQSNRTVYLENGQEFQIQLFNPFTFTIGVDISMNGEMLSKTLIIKPGQRIWLERYFENNRKFKFETYTVDNNDSTVETAIAKNGNIKLEFYKEVRVKSDLTFTSHVFSTATHDSWNTKNTYEKVYNSNDNLIDNLVLNDLSKEYTSSTNTAKAFSQEFATNCTCDCSANFVSTSFGSLNGTITTSDNITPITTVLYNAESPINAVDCAATTCYSIPERKEKETGRIGEGSISTQKFTDMDIKLSDLAFSVEEIKILPMSEKPYTASDLQKIYCCECGRKLNTKYKFCPYCGTKIE
jgi:hypothetical protein